MLMKIGETASKFGITHRSLHYWESAGIVKSTRSEGDQRYYDEENLLKIKQIVLLRKLRISIPSIQEIFTSNELAKVIAVFTDHFGETKKEKEQLKALGIVLRQLITMLKDRGNMDSVYDYLDSNHSAETEELKAALKTVLEEPVAEIVMETLPEPVVDMSGVDLSLKPMEAADIDEVTTFVKSSYANTEDMDGLLGYFNFESQLDMPDCTFWYEIIQDGTLAGAVNLAYSGTESMIIRNIVYMEPDNNIYIFELLKRAHPDIVCWLIFQCSGKDNRYCYHDFGDKKQQFLEDNGFTFYTDHGERSHYIKMLKPHDVVYNNSKYRFAVTDGSMDCLMHRFSTYSSWDFYDGMLYKSRFTDMYVAEALIYASGMERSRFYSDYMGDCDFRYTNLERSKFTDVNFKDCVFTGCDLEGMVIDGINVSEALQYYKNFCDKV